jgi:hypothetical protein
MDRPDFLKRLRSMTRGFAPCDYLKGVVELHRFVESLGESEKEEFHRALLVLLARPEDATPVALNLVQDLRLKQARFVLLSHLYSRDFFPSAEAAVPPSPWTDVQRGLLALALARLGAEAAVPALHQELARRLMPPQAHPGGITRLVQRFVLRQSPAAPPPRAILQHPAEDAEGVHAATGRETRALLQALAILSPATALEHLTGADRMESATGGYLAALLDGLRETQVPCDSGDWVGQALRRLPRSHPARASQPPV